MKLTEKVEEILGDRISSRQSLSGGSIANTQLIRCESQTEYVIKSEASDGDFIKEANGLRELAKADAITIPNVIHAETDFLILDYIQSASPAADFMANFGRNFARLHRYQAAEFGFYEDNFIGSTAQQNTQCSDWTEFFWVNRLEFQLKLAETNGYSSDELRRLMGQLEANLASIFAGSEEKPALLHGDFWSGNFICGSDGQAVIIDPAVYYGHREADLAMTRLFGGFNQSFYAAYEADFPLTPGHEQRENIYKLYHILNHLNIFGSGYYSQAIALLHSALRA
ncbi:MAG: fructosamine kinase family protein [Lentisphaeria bacterium]|nr:fructosamine kinase family protein [Lentisphaeria bacterium]NQZ67370.1 fructosamine kinase family protein [Lentisphaeria bacterium]